MNSIFRRVDLWLPALLYLTGFLLRAEYLREYSVFLNFDVPVGPDVMEYDLRAREILKGRFLPETPDIHAPLYSLFLALIYYVSGCALPIVRGLQLLLNFLSWIFLEKLLSRQGMAFGCRMFFLAAAMLYPVAFFHQAEIISESLLLPFLTAVLWFLELAETEFSPHKRLLRMAGAGCAAGLAAITHPLTLPFAGAVFLYIFFKGSGSAASATAGKAEGAQEKQRFAGISHFFLRKEALAFLAGLLLVILPVVLLKSCRYGKIMGIQQNSGFNFWLGNNPDATGTCYLRPGPVWRKLHKNTDEEAQQRGISSNRVWLEKSAKFWLHSPGEGLRLYLRKAAMVCSPVELIAGADPQALVYRTPLVRYGSYLLGPLMFLALLGLIASVKNKNKKALIFFLLLGTLYGSQILTVTSGRYRLAMLPALLYFAACALPCFTWKQSLGKVYVLLLLIVSGIHILLFSPRLEEGAHEAAGILGEAAIRKNEGQKAFQLLTFAKKGCFDPARISNLLGMLLERSNDFAGAEKEYRLAAVGDPEAMESYMNLANLYARFPARHQEAEKYYLIALEKQERSALLHYNYGLFLHRTRRPAAAEKELLKALACDNTYHLAYNQLGIIALQTQRSLVAEKCFSAAAELAPENPGYKRNLEFVQKLRSR